MKKNALISVIKRECRTLWSRPLYLFTTILFPLFALLFMTTIFGNGMIDSIPVGIVDEDNSAVSREIATTCSAVSEIKVTERFSNTAEARDALLSKKIYAYLIIPNDFQKDMLANRDVSLTLCYHFAFLSVGSEVMQGFLKALRIIAVAPLQQTTDFLGIDDTTLEAIASPISIVAHPLYNPSLDYSAYLSFPYFWVLFQILILLNIAYSFGKDFKKENIRDCLSAGNNKFSNVVIGKLIPYVMIFSIIGFFSNVVMFHFEGYSLDSNILVMTLSCVLFIMATCSIAVFLFSLYPTPPIIISFISMFGSLGATFAGVTFPVDAMFGIFEKFSQLFPIRHFVVATDYLRYESDIAVYLIKPLLILSLYNLLIVISILLFKKRFKAFLKDERFMQDNI